MKNSFFSEIRYERIENSGSKYAAFPVKKPIADSFKRFKEAIASKDRVGVYYALYDMPHWLAISASIREAIMSMGIWVDVPKNALKRIEIKVRPKPYGNCVHLTAKRSWYDGESFWARVDVDDYYPDCELLHRFWKPIWSVKELK